MPKRMKPELHGARGLPPSWSRPKVRTKRKNKRGLEKRPVLSSETPHIAPSNRTNSLWSNEVSMGHQIMKKCPAIDEFGNRIYKEFE